MNNLEKRIKEKFPSENIKVLHYTLMKEPAIVKCLNCNTIYELEKAENFIRKGKKCICKNCVNNGSGGRLSIKDFQCQISKKYPEEELQVLNYTLRCEPCSIKCLKCGNIISLNNASSFMNKDKKRICYNCIPNKIELLNNLKQDFLIYIKNNDNFEIITDINENQIKSDSIIMGKCKKCSYISGRTMRDYMRGRGCPQCANNRIYTNEEYQKILGQEYSLLSQYQGMEHRVLIKHNLCGFCYNTNARHYHCPKCSGSVGEKTITFLLKQKGINYEREKTILIENHKLRFDFYLNDFDCFIEFQGEQHFKPIDYFGGESSYQKQILYDKMKEDWAIANNKIILKINYNEDIKTKLFNFLLKFNDHPEKE